MSNMVLRDASASKNVYSIPTVHRIRSYHRCLSHYLALNVDRLGNGNKFLKDLALSFIMVLQHDTLVKIVGTGQ